MKTTLKGADHLAGTHTQLGHVRALQRRQEGGLKPQRDFDDMSLCESTRLSFCGFISKL